MAKLICEQTRGYVDGYINGNRNTTCLSILAGPNPAVMASKVAVIICREDKDCGMAEEFIRILEEQTETSDRRTGRCETRTEKTDGE